MRPLSERGPQAEVGRSAGPGRQAKPPEIHWATEPRSITSMDAAAAMIAIDTNPLTYAAPVPGNARAPTGTAGRRHLRMARSCGPMIEISWKFPGSLSAILWLE